MGNESAERCETCKCWKRTNEGYELGLCRAHPPAVGHHPGLPETESDGWCVEWKAKDVPRTPLSATNVLSLPIDNLDLTARSTNCLLSVGISTVGELCQQKERELMEIKSFGYACLIDVRKKLRKLGLRLANDPELDCD